MATGSVADGESVGDEGFAPALAEVAEVEGEETAGRVDEDVANVKVRDTAVDPLEVEERGEQEAELILPGTGTHVSTPLVQQRLSRPQRTPLQGLIGLSSPR